MNFFDPILHILFLIASFFAPQDAVEIHVSGPELSIHWTLTPDGWVLNDQRWSVKANSHIVATQFLDHEAVAQEYDVSDYVVIKTTEEGKKTLAVSAPATLEKTKDGFVYREKFGSPEEKMYRVVYKKKAPKPATP